MASCEPVEMPDDRSLASVTARYPAAEITPAEFEDFVVEVLESTDNLVEDLVVTLHDKIIGAGGEYDFDATVRFGWGGMDLVVLVEAKRHKNPVKRDLVQVLHAKLADVRAHKAAMISTAPYQSGALDYAKEYGIALATVTEGRFTFQTKTVENDPTMSREQARESWGLPIYVGHVYGPGEQAGSTSVTILSPEYPEYVVETLFGVALEAPPQHDD
jgi:hypothetical protein